MMRYMRYAFWGVLGFALLLVALANRQIVTLALVPREIASLFANPAQLSLPLYLVVFGAIVLGLLIGFVWEWLREHKHRAASGRQAREIAHLKQELQKRSSPPATAADEDDAFLELLEPHKRA